MATQTYGKPGFTASAARARAGAIVLAGIFASLGSLAGCGHDEENVPQAEVKTVEAYGVTLGPDASPQQVVFVLLRSVADDYAAARAKDHEAQKKAQYLTYSLAAPDVIEDRLVAAANQQNPNLHKTELGPDRDAKIFKTVHYWAPIVGHYVPSFANDLPTLVRDSWVTVAANGQVAHVYYPVSHNPAETDPAKAETATISVELRRQLGPGGAEYWRVATVKFLGRQFRAPTTPEVVHAYGLTLDESASPQQVAAVALRTLGEMVAAEKAGSKDVRASATYRVFNLSYPAKVQPRSRPSAAGLTDIDEPTTRNLATAATQWAEQVQPAVAVLNDPAKVTPERMQAAGAANPDAAQIVYTPDGSNPIMVELAQQPAGGKTFWRVVNVTAQAAAGGSPAQSRPATQATPGK